VRRGGAGGGAGAGGAGGSVVLSCCSAVVLRCVPWTRLRAAQQKGRDAGSTVECETDDGAAQVRAEVVVYMSGMANLR
jgi:hypothetical protein